MPSAKRRPHALSYVSPAVRRPRGQCGPGSESGSVAYSRWDEAEVKPPVPHCHSERFLVIRNVGAVLCFLVHCVIKQGDPLTALRGAPHARRANVGGIVKVTNAVDFYTHVRELGGGGGGHRTISLEGETPDPPNLFFLASVF